MKAKSQGGSGTMLCIAFGSALVWVDPLDGGMSFSVRLSEYRKPKDATR